VLRQYKDCSDGPLTSISDGTSGHDVMKLHIINNRVGKILLEKKCKAKGITQKILHEDVSNDMWSIIDTIKAICDKDSSMSSKSRERLMNGAREAFKNSYECHNVEETVEFSD
jgi:hypothetical protein